MNNFLLIGQADAAPVAQESVTVDVNAGAAPEAQAQPQGMGSGLMQMLPLVLIFVVFMFFMSSSQKKQAKKRQEALNQIMKGDRVVTTGGIYGTVAEVKDDAFLLEIANNVRIEIAKTGVSGALPKVDSIDTKQEK